MISLLTLGIAGGLLALLTTNHFIVDWVFQTHAEAMVKHNNAKVRAKHCLIYTIGFIPLLFLMGLHAIPFLIALNILFWSHFVEDTYIPIVLWAKYIRRPPEMINPIVKTINHFNGTSSAKVLLPNDEEGFKQFISTTLGKILMITIDQIIHMVFLIPIIILAFL